jgi:hypothetical protein
MESLRENKLFDIRLFGSARSGAGSLFSTHKKTALLSTLGRVICTKKKLFF